MNTRTWSSLSGKHLLALHIPGCTSSVPTSPAHGTLSQSSALLSCASVPPEAASGPMQLPDWLSELSPKLPPSITSVRDSLQSHIGVQWSALNLLSPHKSCYLYCAILQNVRVFRSTVCHFLMEMANFFQALQRAAAVGAKTCEGTEQGLPGESLCPCQKPRLQGRPLFPVQMLQPDTWVLTPSDAAQMTTFL